MPLLLQSYEDMLPRYFIHIDMFSMLNHTVVSYPLGKSYFLLLMKDFRRRITLPFLWYRENIFEVFEADASRFLRNLEEMCPRCSWKLMDDKQMSVLTLP